MTSRERRAIGGTIALVLALAAGGASAQNGPQSTAAGIDAQFQSGGVGTTFGPIAAVAGPPSGKYDASVSTPLVSGRVALAAENPTPSFYVSATSVKSHVSGSGVAVDFRDSEGDEQLATANLSLNLYPPPPAAAGLPTPYPPLMITASEVVSTAEFSVVYPATAIAMGATHFGVLTLSGPLVGGKVLKFHGQVAPNTIAYQSPAVTITLNRQIKAGIISCVPVCTFTPVGIAVTAVDVQLNNAEVYGAKVSGEIRLGHATAR
jgi:hypothetical protein